MQSGLPADSTDLMVGHALTNGALRNFLASDDPGDWAKACRLLFHCTALEFVNERSGTETIMSEAQTVLDDYWLKELINATAAEFGRRLEGTPPKSSEHGVPMCSRT